MNEQEMAGQLDFSFQPQGHARRIWQPHELMAAARTAVEREYGDVWVEGEISNYRAAESGHFYFTLKDDASQLKVVMFRSQARLLRFRPENGLRVLARGRVTIYEARGELQLSAEYLEPRGAGALQIAFEQLKSKLQAEGLFAAERKKPLPALPRRIGMVTSPRGAAIHDMLNILQRRHAGVSVLIYPIQVQGETAASEAAAGIEHFNKASSVDVIIVARGGGSMEDLATFNDEALARTIAASTLPVISAIGHETDFTITDFVADLRAPTPSAAAELVIASRSSMEEGLATMHLRLGRAVRYQMLMAERALTTLAQHGALQRIRGVITRREQRLDDLLHRLQRACESSMQARQQRLEVATTRLRHFDLKRLLGGMQREMETHTHALEAAARTHLLRLRGRWQQAGARLEAMSPVKILERGYALVFDSKGKLLKDPGKARAGEEITARLARGDLQAVVKKS